MKIVDVHLHASGRETSRDVLQALDGAGVDLACIMAPLLNEPYALQDPDSLRAANEHVAVLVRGHADRLVGFAVVNPALPGRRRSRALCGGPGPARAEAGAVGLVSV